MASSSQGVTFGGLSGLINVKWKSSRPDPTSGQLDTSTLDLADGSTRTYMAGLSDGYITHTVSASGTGSPPSVGSDYGGYKCVEVEEDNSVGELAKWTATFSKKE